MIFLSVVLAGCKRKVVVDTTTEGLLEKVREGIFLAMINVPYLKAQGLG